MQKLTQQKAPQRPRESQAQLDEQIAYVKKKHQAKTLTHPHGIDSKLELERTIHSMPLSQERDILKQINKLQQQKQKSETFQAYDSTIKEHRAKTNELRDALRSHNAIIQQLRIEHQTLTTAVDLGCHVKDLVGQKLDCPQEKIGPVIGKKGKNIQSIQTSSNVNIDVQKKGDIHLIGTKESIGKAMSDIQKTIERQEETIELASKSHAYMTTAKITALNDLRERHPDTYVNVARGEPNMVVRGAPADIASVKAALEELDIIEASMRLTGREGGMLIGKGGGTIANFVEVHQAVIDVQRPQKSEAAGSDAVTHVKIIGPKLNVEAVKASIETMVAENKDSEKLIVLDPNVRMALLLSNGAAIQALRKKVNEAITAVVGEGIYVAINIQDKAIGVKTRARLMERALSLVRAEIDVLSNSIVKVSIDPFVIPLVIGKGGEGIKKLKEGTTGVNVEITRGVSEICVCGSIKEDVNKVVAALEELKEANQVKRITIDSDESDDSPNTFTAQFRSFLRSPAQKEVQELVFMVADDAMKQIILRGPADNVNKASTIVKEHLSKNHLCELCVTDEDLSALLTGGKESKIVELASKSEVNLSTDRKRQVLIARGEKGKVEAALASVRGFLYGGSDVLVRKIILDDNELKGVVIGKGGKTKSELEAKYPAVSIMVHRSEAAITIRGPTQAAEDCHVEILKLILNASVSRTVQLTADEMKKIMKSNFHRRLGQKLKVQVVPNEEDNKIAFRGLAADVVEAERLLKGEAKGVYETAISIQGDTFCLVKAANQNSKHVENIAQTENVVISLNESSKEVLFAGQKAKVMKAKKAVVSFLEFLLGARMARRDTSDHIMSLVGRPAELAEIQARMNVNIYVDRDLGSIFIFSKNEEGVKKATSALETKINAMGEMICVFQFEEAEGWLLSNIIGRGGAQIKKFRKEANGCNIDVDSKLLKIVVTGNDAERVAVGKKILDDFIDSSRRECMFVTMPTADLPAFVGRSGIHIRELSEKYGVELQIMKNQNNAVRITGAEDKISAARAAIDTWLAAREADELAESVEEKKRIRNDQIPTIIGTKGATISALTKEFGCRIDIDRTKGLVIARGGTPEKRADLFNKIDSLLAAPSEDSSEEQPKRVDVDSKQATDHAEDKPVSKRLPKPKISAIKQTAVSSELLASGKVFPTLPGTDGIVKSESHEMKWPIVKPESPAEKEKPVDLDDVVIMEARDWRQDYYGISF